MNKKKIIIIVTLIFLFLAAIALFPYRHNLIKGSGDHLMPKISEKYGDLTPEEQKQKPVRTQLEDR